MNSSRHERDLLNRYLLGYLPEEERDQVATRLFAEDEFAEALEDAERDLLDDYVRGNLNPEDRAAVASRLLTSDSQREKLRFAEALTRRAKWRKGIPIPRALLWAAAAILLLGSSWLFLRRPVMTEKTAEAPAVRQPVERPAPAPTPIFVALLAPGGVRGDGEMQEIVVPPQAQTVRIELQLQDANAPTAYSVRLVRQRETIFEQSGLSRHLEGDAPVLSIVLRSELLSAGTYRFSATPASLPGQTSEARSYYFRIR